jgi:hypothetical protein
VEHAYRHYVRARDQVVRMKDRWRARPGSPDIPSRHWQERLQALEYMRDAPPHVIDRLRRHTGPITDAPDEDYGSGQGKRRQRFEEKLQALEKRGGEGLLVPEPPALGGTGFEIDGRLHNLETLRFYEALTSLKKAAVLDEFQDPSGRRLVWEIGAGWGGFAYQFKTICPDVTYVITDLPELFLFSGTYLLTMFPDARVAFAGEQPLEDVLARWADYDFLFLPNTALAETALPRLDLTVSMVSFQEMTGAQVEAYAKAAHDLGCPLLYSLNRDRARQNTELGRVSDIIGRYYWLHDAAVVAVGFHAMWDDRPADLEYRHLVGWRRLRVA